MNQNNEKIDVYALFSDFIRVIRRMWIQIVALGVIFMLIMTVQANMRYTPYYTAYSTFTVNIWDEQSENSISSYYDNESAQQMALTFPYILTSGVLQRKVANDLGVGGISGTIKADVVENTNLFILSVTDTDPERAYKTLESVIENYPSLSEPVIGKLNMNVLDESGVPEGPDNPKNLTMDAAKGAVLGLGLGTAWAVMVALLRRTIRKEEHCQIYINKRCLGSVKQIKFKERSSDMKPNLNITSRSIDPDFKEAIRIIRNKVERHTEGAGRKKILITSALAGEGKSTIAVNLAISLAQEGKNIALIDCDLRNPSDAEILEVKPVKGLVDFLNSKAGIMDCLIPSTEIDCIQEKQRLLFLPGGKAVGDGAELLGRERMKEAIDIVAKDSDYVILDSAPVGLLTDAGVLAQYADAALFVVKKDFAKVEDIMNGIEHLAESGIPVIGCVLNGD